MKVRIQISSKSIANICDLKNIKDGTFTINVIKNDGKMYQYYVISKVCVTNSNGKI